MIDLSLQEKFDLQTLLSDGQPFRLLIERIMDYEADRCRRRAFAVTFAKGLSNEERINRIIEDNAKAAALDSVALLLKQALGKFDPNQVEATD